MVVRAKPSDCQDSSSASADPLRGVQHSTPESSSSSVSSSSSSSTPSSSASRIQKHSTELEFARLKKLLPSISRKTTVSKLDVILEAIRYIDQLQDQLLEQIQDNKLDAQVAAQLLVAGKENTHTQGGMMLDKIRR